MYTRVRVYLISALVWLSFFSAAFAPAKTTIISDDFGGIIQKYADKYDDYLKTREQIIIDGICDSACTLVFKLPKKQFCITKKARLGFHQAYDRTTGDDAPDGTAFMWQYYPKTIQTWIEDHGGLGREIKRMTSEDLRKVVRLCHPRDIAIALREQYHRHLAEQSKDPSPDQSRSN